MSNLLSERAKVSRDHEDFQYKNLEICNSNPFDPENNPSGYVNLGVSVNKFCDDILRPKLKDIWRWEFDMLGYKQGRGTLKLRAAMANIMTEFLKSPEPISPDDLFCTLGVTSCIDVIAHCLADPGEVFLVPTPMYGRIYTDLVQRSLLEVLPIPVFTDDDDDDTDNPVLTIEKITRAYESALTAQKVVRGIFLVNPDNPLGDITSPELLMDIMSFCSENSLHFVVDEIYAFSVFSTTREFHSVLKFPKLPDPERTHVLYGLSKDFGIEGLRVGVIHTKCTELQKCLCQLSYLQCIPSPIMENVTTLLEDLEWCKEYISLYQSRLAERHSFCVNFLKEIGVKVRDCSAGFFLWVDLRHICGKSFDEERNFFNLCFNDFLLHIGPSKEFFSNEPGWFRIAITQRADILNEGLRRFKKALESYEPSKKYDN